jgi:hypothetical protein
VFGPRNLCRARVAMLPAVFGLVKGKMPRAGHPSSRTRLPFWPAEGCMANKRNARTGTAIRLRFAARIQVQTYAISMCYAFDAACLGVTLTAAAEPVL